VEERAQQARVRDAAVPTPFGQSFVDFYERTFAPMVRMAVALTGSEALAEDVVQDVFIRVHARWSDVDHPAAYVRTAVVNGCHSARRRAARERSALRRRHREVAYLHADEMFDALSDLPFRQRAALVLHFYERLSHAEIASILECREGTVASLVHRGLAQLRRVVER